MSNRVALRAVGEVPGPSRRAKQSAKPVRAAADSGDRRALLAALRARIATDIDNPSTQSRDLAALSRRLLDIAKELEALDAKGGNDDVSCALATPDEEWTAT